MRDERYLVETAANDLAYLRESWDQEVDDDSLRRSSATLRMLLVDGVYGRAWRAAGFDKQPTVSATDLEQLLSVMNLGVIEYAQAGGARYGGAEISPVLKGFGGLSDQDAQDIDDFLGQAHARQYGLAEFMKSPAIFFRGEYVSRRHVVKYVANKLGGSHLDTDRTRKEDAVYALLDELQEKVQLQNKPAAYFELLAIGQAVASSPDAAVFINHVGPK